MLPVTVTYFCYGWSLWVCTNWLPSFFKEGYQLDLEGSALFASGVFFAGVLGDILGGVISDGILRKTGDLQQARRNVIITGMLGAAACATGVGFSRDLALMALLLGGGSFFLELVIAPIWSVPMDIAPQHVGECQRVMNLVRPLRHVSPVAFGFIVFDRTGNW